MLSTEQIDSAIKRIERGDLEKAIAELKKASASGPDQSEPKRIGEKSVHQSK